MIVQPKLPDPYPLYWPDDWTRTAPLERTRNYRYKVSFTQARDDLIRELKLLGAHDFVICTNLPVRRDGLPLAGGSLRDNDPGVSVWWWDGNAQATSTVLACDQWDRVDANLRAVGLAVSALRALERSGASQVLKRAVAAFEVPLLGNAKPQWFYDLELQNWPPDAADITAAFKMLSRKHHPDLGGKQEDFVKINSAKDAGMRWLRSQQKAV